MTNLNKDLVIYQSSDGQVAFNVNVFEETVWLTQKQMAQLFDKNRKTITEHIGNIFKEGELEEKVVCRNFQHTTSHGSIAGKTQEHLVKYYNLDVIISVGYRVKSPRGTAFRKWATGVLKQYLLNGYAINETRIKSIEEKIDNLAATLKTELGDEIKQKIDLEMKEIYKVLTQISNRPITINNQISLAGHKLEDKIITLIDELVTQLKDGKSKNQLKEIKKNIKATVKDQKTKNKIMKFFTNLGDQNSALHKALIGAKISKNIISELIKLGEKLKNIIGF